MHRPQDTTPGWFSAKSNFLLISPGNRKNKITGIHKQAIKTAIFNIL